MLHRLLTGPPVQYQIHSYSLRLTTLPTHIANNIIDAMGFKVASGFNQTNFEENDEDIHALKLLATPKIRCFPINVTFDLQFM